MTAGVVRVGETVRRPRSPNWKFVRSLLAHLEEVAFGGVPRHLGTDERGREILSFLSEEVPINIDPSVSDLVLAEAARFIRRFHDATAGTAIAEGRETVCHGDLSPCTFVFRDAKPVGIIDFDAAAPGDRLADVGYALFLWLNLGTDGPSLPEQARRTGIFCRAYGIEPNSAVVDAIGNAVGANIDRLREAGRFDDVLWWETQRRWLERHRSTFVRRLGSC